MCNEDFRNEYESARQPAIPKSALEKVDSQEEQKIKELSWAVSHGVRSMVDIQLT